MTEPGAGAASPGQESAPIPLPVEAPAPRQFNPVECPHQSFQCTLRVNRDVDTGTGKVHWTAIINIMCMQCKCPMSFTGCEKGGGLVTKPTTDILGLALSVPLIPGADLMKNFFAPAPATPLIEAMPEGQGSPEQVDKFNELAKQPVAPLTDGEREALALADKYRPTASEVRAIDAAINTQSPTQP